MTKNRDAEIWVKLESNHPAGSVKGRAVLFMIQQAEKRGQITPGDTLIEATNRNTGIALVMIATIKGYKLKLLMPENMSVERQSVIRAYVAEIVLVSEAEGMEGARDRALEMQSRNKGKVLDQFNNFDNPLAHFMTTGPEIWRQTAGRITHFVSSMGTTGIITGVNQYLKSKSNKIEIIGLQPAEKSEIPGVSRWSQDYIPSIFRSAQVDRILDITQIEVEQMMKSLAIDEGIFCGVSAGGAVAGALRVAKQNPRAVIVTIICDRGERYLSTGLFN
ncbi:cysteine synthase B [Arsenophonus endosymbiont of Bemisia tabaci Asia II 3]|nr:cysteine synthase B [Arsenophonus endosymbiont of Bemisia tabaci Asia II 3]